MNGRETLFNEGVAAEVIERVSTNLEVEINYCPRIIVQSIKDELGHRDDPTEESCTSEFAFVAVNGVRAEELGAEKVPGDLSKASAADMGYGCRHYVQGLDPLASVQFKIEPQEQDFQYHELASNESHTSAIRHLGDLKMEPDVGDDELVHEREGPTDIKEHLQMPASNHLGVFKIEPDGEDNELVYKRAGPTSIKERLQTPASDHLGVLKIEPDGEDNELVYEREGPTSIKERLQTPTSDHLGVLKILPDGEDNELVYERAGPAELTIGLQTPESDPLGENKEKTTPSGSSRNHPKLPFINKNTPASQPSQKFGALDDLKLHVVKQKEFLISENEARQKREQLNLQSLQLNIKIKKARLRYLQLRNRVLLSLLRKNARRM